MSMEAGILIFGGAIWLLVAVELGLDLAGIKVARFPVARWTTVNRAGLRWIGSGILLSNGTALIGLFESYPQLA